MPLVSFLSEFKKILQFTIGPICAAGIAFLTLPVLAWMFSPEDIGRITLLQVAVSFSFVFGGMALEQAYAREFYEHSDRAALLKITFMPSFLFSFIVVSMLLLVGVDVSGLLFGVHDFTFLVLVYVCVLANFIVAYSSLILRMSERALAYSLINLSAKGLFLFSVLMVYVLGFSKNFHTLIWLHSLSVVVAMLAAVWLARKEWLAALYANFSYQQLFRYIRFSLPLVFGGGHTGGFRLLIECQFVGGLILNSLVSSLLRSVLLVLQYFFKVFLLQYGPPLSISGMLRVWMLKG